MCLLVREGRLSVRVSVSAQLEPAEGVPLIAQLLSD